MKRRRKASKKAKCHCRKPPKLANMKLSTLQKAVEKKLKTLGVHKR